MPQRSIVERLAAGDVLLMDGGTGTELKRRGFDVFQGWAGEVDEHERARTEGQHDDPETFAAISDPVLMRKAHDDEIRRLGPWSAPANIETPDLVRAIHEDYLRAGADILISNNFFTNRAKLSRVGDGDEWERYARAGARLAIASRDAVKPEAYVAAGIAPAFVGDLGEQFTEQSQVLAEEGVDFMLPEYLGAIDECVIAAEACATAGLPVMLGLRQTTAEGTLQFGDSFDDLAKALDGMPVAGILVMCCSAASVAPSLENLREAFAVPIGAYSHKVEDGPEPDRLERFAGLGRQWIEIGAQIVGGCCGTTPQHIEALAPVVAAA